MRQIEPIDTGERNLANMLMKILQSMYASISILEQRENERADRSGDIRLNLQQLNMKLEQMEKRNKRLKRWKSLS